MIRSLTLRNFKCFGDLMLPLAPMTLLTGLNSMGKSTVIQALLCVAQSRFRELILNGDLIQIGTAKDVLYEGSQRDAIEIGIDGRVATFAYGDPHANELSLTPECTDIDTVYGLLGGRHWQYLASERLGPRTSSEMNDAIVRHDHKIGVRGEYAAHYVSTFTDEPVHHALRHPAAASGSLGDQVDAWLTEIAVGTKVETVSHPEMDLVQLAVSFAQGRAKSSAYRPTNVGFGITYALPIVVAALAAPENSLLIVENPEVHLHPRAQTAIARLLCMATQAGVQVLAESHSDHILNGLRVAVKKGTLSSDAAAVHFFCKDVVDERFVHNVISPTIDCDGRIDEWPAGFFDEYERSLETLI